MGSDAAEAEAAFLEAYVPVASDDQVVYDLDVEQLAGLHYLLSHTDVFGARSRIR